jgi:hypothetical protein
MIFAMTGRAEIESATPMNAAKPIRSASGPHSDSGMIQPSPSPIASGMTRLPTDSPMTGRPRRRSRSRSVSNPVTSSRRRMPSHAIDSSSADWTASPGNNQPTRSGNRRPAIDGPMRTPAAS